MEQEKRQEGAAGQPANDNGDDPREPINPHIRRIAQATGRHRAREHARARRPKPANDNKLG